MIPLFSRISFEAARISAFGSLSTRAGCFSALEYTSIVGKTNVSPFPDRVIPMIKLLTGESSISKYPLLKKTYGLWEASLFPLKLYIPSNSEWGHRFEYVKQVYHLHLDTLSFFRYFSILLFSSLLVVNRPDPFWLWFKSLKLDRML